MRPIGNSKERNVVFITDENYVFQTVIAITSLVQNNDSINIHILAKDISEASENKLKSIEGNNCNIRIIYVENPLDNIDTSSLIKNLPANSTALIKFNIANILKDFDTVLYLDGDIIVNKNISELFNIDIEDNIVGAVSDCQSKKHLLELELDDYFNSGMMLLDLKKIREENCVEKLIDYRINGYNLYMDQDTFNVVFKNRVRFLDFKYNTLYSVLYRPNLTPSKIAEIYSIGGIETYDDLIEYSSILHFSSQEKPCYYIIPGISALYRKYIDKSPYSGCILKYKGVAKNINLLDKCHYVDIASIENKPKISIIIPCHNSERTLMTCINSVRIQTLKDIEIIIIDDASDDNTKRICDYLKRIDERIKVFRFENRIGTNCARKFGVKSANGRYTMFLDSDDFLDRDGCKKLLINMVSTDADIVQFKTSVFGECNSRACSDFEKYINTDFTFLNRDDFFNKTFVEESLSRNLWNRIYKTDVVKKAFDGMSDKYIVKSEDTYSTFMIYLMSESMLFVDDLIYNYRYGNGISTNKSIDIKKFKDICTHIDSTIDILTYSKNNIKINNKTGILSNILRMGFSSLNWYLKDTNKDDRYECLKIMFDKLIGVFNECGSKDICESLSTSLDTLFEKTYSGKSIQKLYKRYVCELIKNRCYDEKLFIENSKTFRDFLEGIYD